MMQARELVALLPNLMLLFRDLLKDPRVPRSSKAWIWFAVVWIASPIDLVPEFIPVLGPLDDAVVAALVLRYVVRRSERSVLEEHWRGNPAFLDRVLPRAGLRARGAIGRLAFPWRHLDELGQGAGTLRHPIRGSRRR